MIRSRFSLLAIIVSLIIFASVGGVYASWTYARDPISPVSGNPINVSFVEFTFAPEEVLPGDEVANEAHGNHLIVIQNIIELSDYNINDGSKKVILNYLNNYGVVYGNYNATSGGTLKKALVGQDETAANVQFMMMKKSDTEYHTYTFYQDDLDDARRGSYTLPDGYIQVYKTIMEYIETENGQMRWVATRSYEGKAKANTCNVGEKNKTVFSIVYGTWVET